MNLAVEFQQDSLPFLVSTPRKKLNKHSLILVDKGMLLVRLGKNEYVVEPGDSVWLPFDCLTSLTFLPGTQTTRVDFSVRLKDEFKTQAGYVTLPDVTQAILTKLATQKVADTHLHNLLNVVRDEVTQLRPLLEMSPLSQQITQWSPDNDSGLSKEMLLMLSLREAKKRMQSGGRRDAVIEEFFGGCTEEFEQLSMMVMGEAL
ncbi:AraC family transcriptional regulator [Vibrio sp. SCSIO 43136]|uniref:AraC family transcriptional regulator n=1 Tax=Vibrio sp. SCSIO 43136 TaxID=2819101 RepID=UPI002074B999|nr:AraC family transcriptional regulator [Vibrio sp. SCSIO 43136]USD68077.1 AraC family transcriptional regulator [Vibrio sp. SCSIO 43136]